MIVSTGRRLSRAHEWGATRHATAITARSRLSGRRSGVAAIELVAAVAAVAAMELVPAVAAVAAMEMVATDGAIGGM
jgi:hypothetical protein